VRERDGENERERERETWRKMKKGIRGVTNLGVGARLIYIRTYIYR